MNTKLKKRMKEDGYKYTSIDLFSGPGGLCTGFKWAGILPLIAVEWTDTTVETYSLSHNADVLHLSEYDNGKKKNRKALEPFLVSSDKTLVIHGDINKVSSGLVREILLKRYGIDSEKETVDVVSGGAPCESFSIAGTRTVNDERDDLFSNILRISRAVKSKMVLFENVKGIFSKPKDGRKGAIFDYICDSFERKGHKVRYKLVSREQKDILLKACDYGVPQLRERIFLVGIRSDLDAVEFTYPNREFGPGCKKDYITSWDAISDLPHVESGEEQTEYTPVTKYRNDNQKFFLKLMRGETVNQNINSAVPHHLIDKGFFSKKLISAHKGPGHTKKKKELLHLIEEEKSMKYAFKKLTEEKQIDQYRDLFPNTIYGSRNRRLIKGEPSFTVTSHCLDEILHPFEDRAITPREAARLQSFPDWYQFAGPYVQFHGDKEQDKYEQIGDAIPPLLAYAIGKQISKALSNNK